MNKIISVKGLKKSYKEKPAVKGIDFYMEEGSLLAFLGPNGAGKSTTINMITTFLQPDAGEIRVMDYQIGKDDHQIREHIGAVFQEGLLDKKLSVEENLMCRGSLYGMKEKQLQKAVKEILVTCELEDIAKQHYGSLSGGQRRRCDIARALIHTPKLLFLDEPTTGLDPQTRRMIWNVIRKIQRESGMSVFLTTHYMEEAAEADYVVVIDDGNISAQGTPLQLKERFAHDRLRLHSIQAEALEEVLQKHNIVYKRINEIYEIEVSNTLASMPILNQCLPLLSDFEVIHGTMDDAFIEIIGKEMRK